MVKNTFNEAFSQDWVDKNIVDPTNELVLFRKIIPWEKLVKQLSQFYSKKEGCFGRSIRVVVAILILAKLRLLSDVKVIQRIRENRYCQYFCNVPDEELFFFWTQAH